MTLPVETGSAAPDSKQNLCLTCGLCCRGPVFKYVTVEAEEAARIETAGFLIDRTTDKLKLCQPCEAHDGQRCTVYADRPKKCANFQCLLLQSYKTNEISFNDARELIDRTYNLLKAIDDKCSSLNLSLGSNYVPNMAITADALFKAAKDASLRSQYGQLSLKLFAVAQLLKQNFYGKKDE